MLKNPGRGVFRRDLPAVRPWPPFMIPSTPGGPGGVNGSPRAGTGRPRCAEGHLP